MKKLASLGSLLSLILVLFLAACRKDKNIKFEGNVIIIGAGASGLAAANKLEEKFWVSRDDR